MNFGTKKRERVKREEKRGVMQRRRRREIMKNEMITRVGKREGETGDQRSIIKRLIETKPIS